MDADRLLIWWIDGDDCRMVGEASWKASMPAYVREEFRARCGRNGRGRLWTPRDIESPIPIHVVVWDDTKATARTIAARSCGGIVFRARDLPAIVGLPGFVTDFNLDLVTAR